MPLERQPERGQVLPLFALFLVVLLAFAALAIDVSGAYSARRFYRSIADGAALAGAQDLQQTGTRTVGLNDRKRARQDAMAHLTGELGIVGMLPAACDTFSADLDVTDVCVLPGTDFHVSIKAGKPAVQPSPIACVECDPERSVQVGLRNAKYHLSFASVLGQASWSVGISSVAGLQWSKSYAVVTLRPPASVGSTYDVKDIKLDGTGTHVTVTNGDVATNSNMVITGSGDTFTLSTGFGMYFADPITGVPTWSAPPAGTRIFSYVADPNYIYPAMSGRLGTALCEGGPGTNCAPTFHGDATEPSCKGPSGTPGFNPACTRADLDPTCGAEATYLKTSAYATRDGSAPFMSTQATNTIYCYQPGIYAPTSNTDLLKVAGGTVALFMPGAYYFKGPNGGLQIQNNGSLLGGYRANPIPGVALMFDECDNQCVFEGTAAETIALNVGNKFPPGASGTSAAPARDWDNRAVETSGAGSPTPAVLMTLFVNKAPFCGVPAYPTAEDSRCDDNHHTTLKIAGGGHLAIEGVQYAPTDNVVITGGSGVAGQVGQLWVWTVNYKGGTVINQQGAGSTGPGVLRLDAACTAPGTPCNP